jgi:hypothetical protein
LMLLQDKITRGDREAGIVKPRRDAATLGGNLVQLGKKDKAAP